MTVDPLRGKRVLVLGYGRQGRALTRWLPTLGARVVVSDQAVIQPAIDELPPGAAVEFVSGDHPLQLLDTTDLVCLSGGVPLTAPIVRAARERGIPLANDAQLFLERCPAQVIGITGSAGKTTTTSLVAAMLRAAGRRVWTGGNIGHVLLDDLAQMRAGDVVAMELSSFQLELMTRSPQLAVVLNVTPNHLDRHGTMAAYTAAKARILDFQAPADCAVLACDDLGSRALAQRARGHVTWFGAGGPLTDGAWYADQALWLGGHCSAAIAPQRVCARADSPLPGDHNLLNLLAACATAGAAGVPAAAMAEAISSFRGVAHRLEPVRDYAGVTWVNDSIATAPERVLAALRSYDAPLILLAGGKDKQLPWEDMLRLALQKTRCIIAFGHFGEQITAQTRRLGGKDAPVFCVPGLIEAVDLAARKAQAGDVVLLSPGGTSYDAYRDFAERGAHFRQLVQGL